MSISSQTFYHLFHRAAHPVEQFVHQFWLLSLGDKDHRSVVLVDQVHHHFHHHIFFLRPALSNHQRQDNKRVPSTM